MTRNLLFALLLFSNPAIAQGPSADWRTITTAHFRVHFPAQDEAWARRAAANIESVRTADRGGEWPDPAAAPAIRETPSRLRLCEPRSRV